MKNNKGFVVTEVLILSTVLIGLLVFMFIQFKNINRSYQYSFKYDTVGGMYLANNIVNFINEYDFDNLVQSLSNSIDKYLDITECSVNYFSVSSLCEDLIADSRIDKVLFTYEDTSIMNKTNLDEDFKLYIKNIQTQNSSTDYRIIVKYIDGTYASMRFNKGDVYVQNGLIAYLDGINNTGYGHSNDADKWVDLSGNDNDATLYNNPTWNNNSVLFDGIDDFGVLTNTANINFINGVTVETRVKVISFDDGYNTIFIDNNSLTKGIGEYIDNSLNKITSHVVVNNTDKNINYDSKYNLNEYYTITITYNNSSINLYINGNLVNTVSATGTYSLSTNPFNLANLSSIYSNVEFENVLIYERALTQEEVTRNYQVDMIRY